METAQVTKTLSEDELAHIRMLEYFKQNEEAKNQFLAEEESNKISRKKEKLAKTSTTKLAKYTSYVNVQKKFNKQEQIVMACIQHNLTDAHTIYEYLKNNFEEIPLSSVRRSLHYLAEKGAIKSDGLTYNKRYNSNVTKYCINDNSF